MKRKTDTPAATSGTRTFYVNKEVGRGRREITDDLRELSAETRKRTNNKLPTEDQAARRRNLRDARSRLN
jgi:hypothetical protein